MTESWLVYNQPVPLVNGTILCGRSLLKNGEREVLGNDGSKRIEYVEDFNLSKIDYFDANGEKIGYYTALNGDTSIIVGPDNQLINGKFVSLVYDYQASVEDGHVTNISYTRDYYFAETDRVALNNQGVSDSDLFGFKEAIGLVDGFLNYKILPPNGNLFNIDEAAGKAWLDSIQTSGEEFYKGVWALLKDALPTDPKPIVVSDSANQYADIDLNLEWPIQRPIQSALDFIGNLIGNPFSFLGTDQSLISLAAAQTRLNTNTNLAAQLRADLAGQGYKFIMDSGDYVDGLTIDQMRTFYGNLNTNKSIQVGFSFGSVDQVKMWAIPGSAIAGHTILISPQLPPEITEQMIRARGIDPNSVTIIDINRDLPPILTAIDAVNGWPRLATDWSSSYADNLDADGHKKWNYVKLMDGGNLSPINIFSNHGAGVDGIIRNLIYQEIAVNGVPRYNRTLSEILSELIADGN